MTGQQQVIRVLIADDQPLVRDGLAALLSLQAGLEIVGSATNGAEAVEQARAQRPGIILMDVRMPVLDGIGATERVRAEQLPCRVLMLTTFDGFFRRLKAGQTPGYPRFRGKGWYNSFTYRQWGNGAHLERGRLVLSKLGAVRIVRDRPLQGIPKTCTIVRKADGWYAHIACEVPVEPLPSTGKVVGLDLGLESFATLSDGTPIANPRLYRAAERKLRRAQRRLSRRVKGSNRRRKARELVAKAHLKVQRARLDFAHKTARCLVNEYDQIVVEKLNIKGMVRNHPLAKSISDAGWGLFVNVLRAKAESAGRVVLEVNAAGTSQTCAACGEHAPKRLAVRWHSCPYCGCELHRDHNAALNILQKGGGTAFGEALPLGGPQNREPGTL